MPSQYLNFAEYAKNDKQYFLRSLKGELHRIQKKIEFRDGTTYHVTKSGSRYWEKDGSVHRENGLGCEYENGGWYSLFGVSMKQEEHKIAVERLNFLRLQTNNRLEDLVKTISKNINYENRQKLWRSILLGGTNSTEMLASLEKLSKQYQKLTLQSEKFINDFS